MKTLTIVKDAYIEKSVRVNYFDNNAIRKEKRMKDYSSLGIPLSGEFPSFEQMFEEVDVVYPNLIFCERLNWNENENELDEQIEAKKKELENQMA